MRSTSSSRSSVLSLAACALALAATPLGCGDDEVDPLAGKARAFVTYNLGLATGYVSYAAERRPQLVTLLQTIDADVLCLQEVWSQADVDAVIAGVAETYPYAHYQMLKDTTVGPPACTESETQPIRGCIDTKCTDVSPGELADCVLANCVAEFGQLSTDCTNCAVANLGKEVDVIFDTCTTGSSRYTYEGANGLLMLSRAKLTNKTHLKIEPSTNVQRSVLGATVRLPDLGEVAFFCSHIAADLDELPYSGPEGSWEGENRKQGQIVRDFAAEHAGDASLVVIAGDYNSGPAVPDKALEELPEASYKVFVDAGFLPHGPSDCSYCEDNLLNIDGTRNVWIDHLFTKGLDAARATSVTRFGTTAITITSQTDGTVQTHPSDHYGVRLEIQD